MKRRLNQLSACNLVSGLYFLVSIFSWFFKYFNNRYNNYSIFKYVYYHTVQQKNLYNYYPAEYGDSNHYGVVFSLLIAPFALLPDGAGFLLFCILNAALIVLAIRLLPLPNKHKMFIMLFSVMEFANASHYIQFNAVITAIIIFSFLLVEDEKDEWATLFIVLGTLIKLYPIVGITFFLFSKHKVKFVMWGLIWTGVFLALPMLISSRQFVLQCYVDWYESLHAKNLENLGLESSQDISVMGTARHLTRNINIPNWPFLLLGVMGFGLPLLRIKQYPFKRFRYQVLASALMLIVLFSTGSEHPTYIIAVVGATLWIFMNEKPFTRTNIVLLVLLVLITGLGPTDAFPKYIRHEFINKYVMKAWPCIAVWCIITYELMFKNFANAGALTQKKQQSNTESELVLV
ncbi:glycosyltransferase family 87 protein [Mucilaginibacter aquatilis]|uniref:DUF2029 domain-containing protein n=1 Tax=Mucilaginibacter aquatilis TaxID=1517760 RepID=A0A6I4IQE6_9SPHI|nr:glycosyltransferase family 87 protein [Mucilaginibacter aquatilis]MVN91024.1 DUF2029 domain-containing protein [Mucilaginibacter aquatilis]